MSLKTQRLITPPEPMQTALVPQLEQEEKVGEKFFVDQAAVREPSLSNGSSDVFIGDGDDDESPVTEPGRLEQREVAMASVSGWCNGDAVRLDGSMATVAADTLSQMPHGRWRSCIAMGMSSGIVYTGASPWSVQISRCDSGVNLGMTNFGLRLRCMTARARSSFGASLQC